MTRHEPGAGQRDSDRRDTPAHAGAGRRAHMFQGVRRRERDGRGGEPTVVPQAEFGTYYGRPVVKPPVWEYKIAAYLFTGGLAAGTAVLAAGADLTGRRGLRKADGSVRSPHCWPASTTWSPTSAGPSGSTTCSGSPSRPRR